MEIDYSTLPNPPAVKQEDWDPPPHKFFGKKDAAGKMEKEPVYVHKDYPRIMYAHPDKEKPIVTTVVNSEAEMKNLGPGWEKNPSIFGHLTAPSLEEHLRSQGNAAIALADEQAAKSAEEARKRTDEALAAAQAETDARIHREREAAEAALQKRIADAVAAALPDAVAAAMKRGPGRPPKE